MRLAWESWLYGLLAAVISAGSGAVASSLALKVIVPNMTIVQLLESACVVFTIAAVPVFFGYLHQQPLPPITTVTTTEIIEKQKDPPATVTTTIEKTETKAPGD